MDLVISTPNVKFTTQFGAQSPAFQIGEVLDAQVLQLLDDGRARLSVANLIIDVQTQVPLVPGTTVKLAVKGTGDAIKLVLLDPAAAAALATDAAKANAGSTSGAATLKAGQAASAGAAAKTVAPPPPTPSTSIQPPAPQFAPDALTQATRLAAAQQNGLAPLFADVEAALQSAALPPEIRRAATLLLGMRPVLDENLSAADLKQAVDGSGIFFEARVAAASASPLAAQTEDLKAALIVFRQVLKNWVGPVGEGTVDVSSGAATQISRAPANGSNGATPGAADLAGEGAALPAADSGELIVTQAVLRDAPADAINEALSIAAQAGETPAAKLQAALPGLLAATNTVPERAPLPTMLSPSAAGSPVPAAPAAATSLPPPLPYRGAPTVGQPPAVSSLTADTPPREIGAVLVKETEAALSRHTLLQAASVTDRPDPAAVNRPDPAAPRWYMEIPFATPQGTAIAQFEISRDGRAKPEAGSASVWRVRFSIDVEPIGPVHAQVALIGQRAAVTLWAERAGTAARLREGATQLKDALTQAELEAGDVLIRDGTPPRPQKTVAAAGRFLDRAS